MSSEGTLDQAAEGTDRVGMLLNAVRQLVDQTRSFADAADLIVRNARQSVPELEDPAATFQVQLTDFQSFTLDLVDLLVSQAEHERQQLCRAPVLGKDGAPPRQRSVLRNRCCSANAMANDDA